MIPPQDMMLKLTETIERQANKVGWDQPAVLYLIFREELVGHHADLFVLRPFPVQPQAVCENAAQGLLWLATHMITGNSPPLLAEAVVNDFAGVAFLGEGWMPEDPERALYDQRGIADLPGSKEIRFAHLLDCAGRYYFVIRERGGRPVSRVVKGRDDLRVMGAIVIGLRDLLLSIGRELPLGSMDLDEIRGIGAETLEDLTR